MYVSINCSSNERTDGLYVRAKAREFIEYVAIYPHRILYGCVDSTKPSVRVMNDEKIYETHCTSNEAILVRVDSSDFQKQLEKVFDAIKSVRYKSIFIQFSDQIDYSLILSIVENISKSLQDLKKTDIGPIIIPV